MLYTPLTKKAMKICLQAHAGQTERSGMPYATHPFHVAEQMRTENETCAALLHDVVEDTAVSLDDLKAAGFPPRVIGALALLTHDPQEPYLDYVRRIAELSAAFERKLEAWRADPTGCDEPTDADYAAGIAKAVKIADLQHNSDLGRLDEVTDRDRDRVAKYAQARAILGDA